MFKNSDIKLTAVIALTVLVIVTVFFGVYAHNNLKFTSDLERLYKEEDQAFNDYISYKNAFLKFGERTLVTVRTEDTILDYNTLNSIKKVTESISNLPQVTAVKSVTNIRKLVKAPFLGPILVTGINTDKELTKENYLSAIQPKWHGTFVSNDLKGFSLHLTTNYEMTGEEVEAFEKSLDAILRENNFSDFYLTGRLLGQNKVLSILKNEMMTFMFVSLFLICLILFVLYRSFWSIVRTAIVLLICLVWTMGLIAIFGKPLDVLSSIIPPILFVTGTSDLVHIYEKYRHELRETTPKNKAIKIAFINLSKATLITSITTMIGFLSLLMSSIKPIQELGMFLAIGVGVAYILTFSLFPALLVLTPSPEVATHRAALYPFFERSLKRVLSSRKKIFSIAFLLMAIGVWSVSQLKVDNYLTEDLPNDDKYNNGYNYLESQFSGARPLEFAITFNKSTNDSVTPVFNRDDLLAMDRLDKKIRSLYETEATFSILDIPRELKKLETPEQTQFKSLTRDEYRQSVKPYLVKLLNSKVSEPFVSKELGIARIAGLSKDWGGAEMRNRNNKLLKFAQDSCQHLTVQVTGIASLVDQSNYEIATDMLKGLAAALLLVSILMSFLYRSIKLILVALIPNILPLLAVAIVMWLFKIDIKISTALIFTVAFGIVVDDTIHFLSKMKQELSNGLSTEQAIRSTFITTGRSIVITSIILCSGFIALSFSAFTSTLYMGVLVSLTLLFAVISDLTLLPNLLNWLLTKKK